jgi:hypothetical protein
MLNSISMNKQYGSLKENQSSKATDSNWIATPKAYEHSKFYYCKKKILLVCKNPSISNLCYCNTQHVEYVNV